jgi:hypothetical protein
MSVQNSRPRPSHHTPTDRRPDIRPTDHACERWRERIDPECPDPAAAIARAVRAALGGRTPGVGYPAGTTVVVDWVAESVVAVTVFREPPTEAAASVARPALKLARDSPAETVPGVVGA